MGTIKLGQAEKKLISEIEAFKEKYKDRFAYMEEGLEIAVKQLPRDAKGEVKNIEEKISEAKAILARLRLIIQNIAFSIDDSGEKFSVTWSEFNETSKQHYQYVYGAGKEGLTEKQLVHAITSWESEIRKALLLFKQIAGYSFNSFCSKMEQHVHKIIYEYVNPKTT